MNCSTIFGLFLNQWASAWQRLKPESAAVCFCTILAAWSGSVSAGVPVPTGLAPGAKYHLAFTTSTRTHTWGGDWLDIASFIRHLVVEADIDEGIVWYPIVSIHPQNARDLAVVGAHTPVYNMHMELVATGFDDFWDGKLQSDLGWNEYGSRIPDTGDFRSEVWTGSEPDGALALGLDLRSNTIRVGSALNADDRWISENDVPYESGLRHFYVLSQELVAPGYINVGLNDGWSDEQTPGQGFFITVFPESKKVFLAWLTFDTERPAENFTAFLGDPGQRWLTAYGDYAGNSAVLEVEVAYGGVFDTAEPKVTIAPAFGTITLDATSCNKIELQYDLPSVARAGIIELTRISDENVALCEELLVH